MKTLYVAALLTSAVIAAPVGAELLQFTLTGDYNASFQLDSDPAIDNFGDASFTLYNSSGSFFGSIDSIVTLQFYTDFGDGGFVIYEENGGIGGLLVETAGPQLFSGTQTDPTFRTGTFALVEYGGVGAYSLTIAPVGAAVPEPATWAMMIGGFGLVGGAMRRRQKVSYTAA